MVTAPGRRLTGTVVVEAGRATVTLVGDADGTDDQGQLRRMLQVAVAATGPVVVDVSGLARLGDQLVDRLVGAAEQVHAAARTLGLRGTSPEEHGRLVAAGLGEALAAAARPPGPADRGPGPAVRAALAGRAGSGPTRDVLDAALSLVTSMAQAVILHADGVSITLPRDGRYGTVAASDATVLAMDHDQYDTDQGPCLDAARQGERFHVDTLAEEHRWSQFVPRARARGIVSILSSPLRDGDQPHGALNIYSTTAGAFAEHEMQWAHLFAQQASTVLTAAHAAMPSHRLSGQLDQALVSRDVVARTTGLVMHRDGVDADAAWAVLRATSRSTSRPLLDICEDLLAGSSRAKVVP